LEQSINYERVSAKQMKRDGVQHENKEKFLTQSFIEMLKKNDQFEKEDKVREEWNQKHTAGASVSRSSNF
jgi:hypothetical protein